MSNFDPYTLEQNGLSGIEHYRRQALWKSYWEPLAKMWGYIAKKHVIWGYDNKYGANLPLTVDMTSPSDSLSRMEKNDE